MLGFAGFISASPADSPLTKLASRVDVRYNHLNSLRADFEEIYEGPGTSRKESGVLWLQKPGKMLWDYQQPKAKTFVTDGKNAYFYVAGSSQAQRMPVKKLEDFRSPIRFLLGHTKLREEFEGLTISRDRPLAEGNRLLEGVPKNMKERVSRVLLEVNPEGQIVRIRVEELDESSTEFRFSNIEEGVRIRSELFKFRVPAGVQLIDANEVGQ
jgi:outer membrane lipoprotein carrier protein